jgi:regulation of enolase protein 1 (concanavalin A-like superfamily)
MVRSHQRLVVALAACLLASTASVGGEPSARRVPEWGEVVDPSRDCKVTHDPERDRLTVAVPGTPHVLTAGVAGPSLGAPRVVQGVSGGFKATVRVVGRLEPGSSKSTHYDPFHGAGLIVWKDDRNYLCLERAVGIIQGRRTPYLNYELREHGRLVFSRGLLTKDQPVHLKIERLGGEIRAWQSADGSKWTELPALPAPITGRVDVGVVAVNSSRRLLRAELERFRLDMTVETKARREAATESTSKPAEMAGDRQVAK